MLSEKKDSRDTSLSSSNSGPLSLYSSSSGQLSSFKSVVKGRSEVRSSMSGSSRSDRTLELLLGDIMGELGLTCYGPKGLFSSLRFSTVGRSACMENAFERLGPSPALPPYPSIE